MSLSEQQRDMVASVSSQPTRRKRAVIYCRVSTDKQEQDGESLDYQEEKGRQYAALNDIDVILVLHEVITSRVHYSLRTKLSLARQMIRDGLAEIIIVWDLRRFARSFAQSVMIFEEIESHGGTVISIDERIDNTREGKLVRSIIAWGAESEREKILEYANRRWKTRIEAGLPVGTGYAPYGWSWGDEAKTYYVLNQEEAIVRFSIFHMFVELDMSLRSIAHKLTEDGIPTPTLSRWTDSPRGRYWSHATLYDFLKDPIAIGTLTICKSRRVLDEYGKTKRVSHPDTKTIPNVLPPIVSAELYERAQRKLATNQVEQSHLPEDPTAHLLRGHIRCGTCGRRMNMRIAKQQTYRWPIYLCDNRRNKYNRCPDMSVIRADWLDPLVWTEVCQMFERFEALQATIEAEVQRKVQELLEDSTGNDQTAMLQTAIEHAYLERTKHAPDSYLYDLISEDIRVKTEQMAHFEAERTNARDVRAIQATYRQRLMSFLDFLNVMRGRYASATFQEKRNALDVLGVMVTYTPRSSAERHRGRDATPEEMQRRISITYSPLYAGVASSLVGRPTKYHPL